MRASSLSFCVKSPISSVACDHDCRNIMIGGHDSTEADHSVLKHLLTASLEASGDAKGRKVASQA